MMEDNGTKSPVLKELKEKLRKEKEKRAKKSETPEEVKLPVRVPKSVPGPEPQSLLRPTKQPSQTSPPRETSYGGVIDRTLTPTYSPAQSAPVIKYIPRTPMLEPPTPHPSLSLPSASQLPSSREPKGSKKVVIPPKNKQAMLSPEDKKKHIDELNHSIKTYQRKQQSLIRDPLTLEDELERTIEHLDHSRITFGHIVDHDKITQLRYLVANVLYLSKQDTEDSREKYFNGDKFLEQILIPFAKETGHDISYYEGLNFKLSLEKNPLEAIKQCANYLQDKSIELTNLFEYGVELIIQFYDSLVKDTRDAINKLKVE